MARTRPSSARRWLIRIGILIAVVSIGVLVRLVLPQKTLLVRAATAEVGTVRDVVSSSAAGEVAPELRATVRAEAGGSVVKVLKQRGDRVAAGEVVIRLDAQDLDARVSQAQAAVGAASGQLMQTRARVQSVEIQAERARRLLSRGAGTAQLSEDAESALREARLAVRAMEGQLEQARAALKLARVARSRAAIEAPFSGLLTDVHVSLGDVLAPGAPVFQIIDDRRLHVDATIDEADAAKVRAGQEAELKLDALPEQPILGKVVKVDPVVKRDLKGSRTLAVEVEVQNVEDALSRGLKPGMSANVEIKVAEKQDVLYLPSNAIIGRGVSRSVYLLKEDGRHHRVSQTSVQIGLSNWERTEIISGLARGQRVVQTLNVKGLEDGVLVDIEAEDKGTRR